MKFLVDAQLPQRLAVFLRSAGHDVIHTLELPNANRTTDPEIHRLSAAEQRIVVSKNRDFVDSHLLVGQPERLLWVTTGNIRNDALLALFADNLAALEKAFVQARFVELTRTSIIIHQ